MKITFTIFLFVCIPFFTFSQKWNEPQAYEIVIPYLMGQYKVADSLKIILYCTTDTSVICFPANQYHEYLNGDSIMLQEIPYRKMDYIYFNKKGNTLGKTLLISSGFGLLLGIGVGYPYFDVSSYSYSEIEYFGLFAAALMPILGFIVGSIAWSNRSHVNVGYSKTISKKKRSEIEKYTLVKSE